MATRTLDDRVTALESTVAGLQNLPGELAAFREEVDARLDAIERRITDENERLYARMLPLHEDLVARIALIGEHPRRPKR
jgi:predicted  nucleic acid-binding Zn-ribbon protein